MEDYIKQILEKNEPVGIDEKPEIINELIQLVEQKHPFIKRYNKNITQKINRMKKRDDPFLDEDFGPLGIRRVLIGKDFIKMQENAVNCLSNHISNDEVYQTLWRAASGKIRTDWANMGASAKKVLAINYTKRKKELEKIAINPEEREEDRKCAYQILCCYGFSQDQNILNFLSNLSKDTSMSEYCYNKKKLTGRVEYEYQRQLSSKKGEIDEAKEEYVKSRIKEITLKNIVSEVQKDFRESMMYNVMDYVFATRKGEELSEEIKSLDTFRFHKSLADILLARTILIQEPLIELVIKRYTKLVITIPKIEKEMLEDAVNTYDKNRDAENGIYNLYDEKGRFIF